MDNTWTNIENFPKTKMFLVENHENFRQRFRFLTRTSTSEHNLYLAKISQFLPSILVLVEYQVYMEVLLPNFLVLAKITILIFRLYPKIGCTRKALKVLKLSAE